MSHGGQERRRYPRVDFPCRLVLGSPLRAISSHTENISEGGLRVILEEKLLTFTEVGVEFFVEKRKTIKCKGRIVWVVEKINPLDKEAIMFDTGIEFTGIKDADKGYIRNLIVTLLSKKQEY